MRNYNIYNEPVTEVAIDKTDIKNICNEKRRNEE